MKKELELGQEPRETKEKQGEKVLCMVGGWEVMARPGEAYTFGQEGNCWGPIPVSEIEPGMDVEGFVFAKPKDKKDTVEQPPEKQQYRLLVEATADTPLAIKDEELGWVTVHLSDEKKETVDGANVVKVEENEDEQE